MPETADSLPTATPSPVPRRSPLRRPRLWIGLAVLAWWVTMMVLVWRNETGRIGANLREMGISREVVLSTWVDFDDWTAIEQQGRWLGASRLGIRRRSQGPTAPGDDQPAGPSLPGFNMLSRTRMQLPVMGMQLPLDLQMTARLNSAFELETMQAVLDLAGQPLLLEGFVEGSTFYYRIRTGNAAAGAINLTSPTTTQPIAALVGSVFNLPEQDLSGSMPLQGPILMRDAVLPILSRTEKLEPGATWTTQVASPLAGQLNQTVHVRVLGKEPLTIDGKTQEAWKLIEQVGQIKTTVWYNDQGQQLRRDLGNGLILTSVSAQRVLQREPELRTDIRTPLEPDRDWIRSHQDPALKGKPLQDLLPQMPQL